ncbi:hypothetical protein WH47_07288 [Habropoda laboriosa]|uniref:Uncharacterized protein n=1 Tax=Habropoda laboriosa TaxID=597456 RepID=A0A0L7R5X4_9HYME|nr:hypothetical protein WH47_07288 [Habropoda laboriosa]
MFEGYQRSQSNSMILEQDQVPRLLRVPGQFRVSKILRVSGQYGFKTMKARRTVLSFERYQWSQNNSKSIEGSGATYRFLEYQSSMGNSEVPRAQLTNSKSIKNPRTTHSADDIVSTKDYVDDIVLKKDYVDDIVLTKDYVGDIVLTEDYTVGDIVLTEDYVGDIVSTKDYVDDIVLKKDYVDDIVLAKDYVDDIEFKKDYVDDIASTKDYRRYSVAKDYVDDIASTKDYRRYSVAKDYVDDIALKNDYFDDIASTKTSSTISSSPLAFTIHKHSTILTLKDNNLQDDCTSMDITIIRNDITLLALNVGDDDRFRRLEKRNRPRYIQSVYVCT